LKKIILLLFITSVHAQQPRARDLGSPFDGVSGPFNAITDVAGVTVGEQTLHRDLADGRAVRTGITAILPRGKQTLMEPVMAATFALNGNGEMSGAQWIEEGGFLEGPIMLTNTHSVGVVRDATIAWRIKQGGADSSGYWWSLPVVAETWDGDLNDINGFHIKAEDVFAALENAHGGPVAEGNVGGGTGMVCHQFKCGNGSSSRIVKMNAQAFTVGVLVQANYGVRKELRVAGVPIGPALMPSKNEQGQGDNGSIIIVVGTDAPLLPHQLKRLAKRAALGLARNGSYAGNGSGDIFIAFSTANEGANQTAMPPLKAMPNENLDELFLATVQASEEAIINALIAAKSMSGNKGYHVDAIDHAKLLKVLTEHRRLNKLH
jgi:D-aminopeptidase